LVTGVQTCALPISVDPNYRNGYIESFNMNVQQALPGGFVGSLGFYGSVGRHLRDQININQASGPVGSARPFPKLSANSPILPGLSINSNISQVSSSSSSNYNAMWAVLTKNMVQGLSLNMNYNWSKSMDLNSLGSQGGLTFQDSNNPAGNYGLSDFDTRNHFAGNAIYAFPWKGNRFVSGFQVSSIIQYQTGNPVNFTAGSDGYNGVTGLIRPNQLGPVTIAKSQGLIANVTYLPASNVCATGVITGCALAVPA